MYSRFTYYLVVCFDFILIQPWIKVMYCSLIWLTLHIRAGISIWIVAHGRCCISCCFYFILFFYLYFSKSCKPDQFLILIKVSFFSNLPFLSSFKSLLLLLLLWFLLLLLLFSLPSSLLSEALLWLLLVVALLFSITDFFIVFDGFFYFLCIFWFTLISHFHCVVMSWCHHCYCLSNFLILFRIFPFLVFYYFVLFYISLNNFFSQMKRSFVCLFVCLFFCLVCFLRWASLLFSRLKMFYNLLHLLLF